MTNSNDIAGVSGGTVVESGTVAETKPRRGRTGPRRVPGVVVAVGSTDIGGTLTVISPMFGGGVGETNSVAKAKAWAELPENQEAVNGQTVHILRITDSGEFTAPMRVVRSSIFRSTKK